MRKFIHIDMDCFYAAVEMRDNPELRGIPIAIGGSADRRGVVSTCNYEARAFGVRSAMATATALRLCPKLTLVRGRMDVYKEVSDQIKSIFLRYTDEIEPLSLDEAFLDVTDSDLFEGSATLIANDIRQAIERETGLTASAGVAPIKFVAKVASDENKPNGICVITPNDLDDFVRRLPLKKIPGVGKVTLEKLNKFGLFKCEDIRHFPIEKLHKHFGKFGASLWKRAHAIDERRLSTNRKRKSIGVERTLDHDLSSLEECQQVSRKLLPTLYERMNTKKRRPIKSIGVKLKFSDFQQTTVEQQATELDEQKLFDLLSTAFERGQGKKVRLVGMHVSLAEKVNTDQLVLPLFTEE
ncbi:DNA polymerase IV [Glaciecola sp. MH2013]|uniref:DNA polymerase IV n=1 Tax=Glaciecola sp. MH2013 TaxID=2785524 RepID=UPI0018A08A91|nr:DNA polymerase IV [Glaciecola sp. MH2013]MBF7075017.1 DNA polymerase IV [Glaciecola sp. MH2013]